MKKFNVLPRITINARFQSAVAIMLLFGTLFTSCMTEEAVLPSPGEVVERIDVVFDGSFQEDFFLISEQSGTAEDLVNYHRHGSTAGQVDFVLNLGDGITLVLRVVDKTLDAPWRLNGNQFSLFAASEIEDKLKYVTAEFYTDSESPVFQSMVGTSFPRGTYVNVFKIVRYDEVAGELFCRISDLPLAHSANIDDIVWINGTFRGSIADLN